jgi:ribosome-binding factor A
MGNRHRQARRGTDPGAGIRALRLEQLFREELRSVLEDELFDARFEGVRITLVELSRDGSRARVWYCMKHHDDASRVAATRDAFSRAAGYLRTRLCDALPLKRAPELSFRLDPAALFEQAPERGTS